MSTMWITEFQNQGNDGKGRIAPIPEIPAIANQKITFTATSVQSAALNASTEMVRVTVDADACILAGTNPTALASASTFIKANMPFDFAVKPGDKIAVITAI